MKNLVEVITKALVDEPENVVITEKHDGKTTIIEVRVSDNDMGKVIGKQGRIAKAIRSVVKAAAAKEDKKVVCNKLVKEFLKVKELKLEELKGNKTELGELVKILKKHNISFRIISNIIKINSNIV